MVERKNFSTGVKHLDALLDGLYIGDNVVWHDDAGSLASVFCMNFIKDSRSHRKPMIYVSFDRSLKNLLDHLGDLANYENLTILDCFTYGKGAGTEIFKKFYNERLNELKCNVRSVKEPDDVDHVMNSFYGLHSKLEGDVRFIFESLTGMQELWGGEEHIIKFYAHSCPRLYELNTIAYWIVEKGAHSQRLKSSINQIAQVAIDLSVKKGTTTLKILKAEKRDFNGLNKPFTYWVKDLDITFDSDEKRIAGNVILGMRLKALRSKRGISQSELARLVGVTPSTISQIEHNQIFPSIPALLKMAEVLSVGVDCFFQDSRPVKEKLVFRSGDASVIKLGDFPEEDIFCKLLTSVDMDSKAEPYLVEISAGAVLHSHFFIHKGEEMGYLLNGNLQVKFEKSVYEVEGGDLIYLISGTPLEWKNTGSETAMLLWMKIR